MEKYITDTWGLNQEQAKEVMDFADTTIRPNNAWVEKVKKSAQKKGRSVETQLVHASRYHLYPKEEKESNSHRYIVLHQFS